LEDCIFVVMSLTWLQPPPPPPTQSVCLSEFVGVGVLVLVLWPQKGLFYQPW